MPRLPHRPGDTQGFSLTEAMIVIVLAGVVTLGLVTFYLNSQRMWTEGSTQVLAQRDATTLIEVMRDSTQEAASAEVFPVPPDSLNHLVIFFDGSHNERNRFFWVPTDSFIHYGTPSNPDQGPVVPARVARFYVSADPALGVLSVDTLRVLSSIGQSVTVSTTMGLYNH